MCKVLEVSRSGFYAWVRRDESARTRADRELADEIRAIHEKSRGTYGVPRIHAELQHRGNRCGRKRVARLMRELGIRAKAGRKFRVRTTDSNHALPVAPNLVAREFVAETTNELWVSDITYIPTAEGWLYLASIIDGFSRRVVGWAMESHMRTSLVLGALQMALQERQPDEGLVHHSDRGSQYASKAHRNVLDAHGIACSMSRSGDCYDNAMKESFFHTLKVECVHDASFATRAQARAAIFEFLAVFYNRQRLHSSLDYRTPEEFERAHEAARAA